MRRGIHPGTFFIALMQTFFIGVLVGMNCCGKSPSPPKATAPRGATSNSSGIPNGSNLDSSFPVVIAPLGE